MERAYFIWAVLFVLAIGLLLLDCADPSILDALGQTCRSFLSWSVLGMVALAFGCEYVDSTLGMGYGTTLTPILLLMGFQPLQIVPAVLLSELLTGITSGVLHHGVGNVTFRIGSRHLKVLIVLAACSIMGTLVAVMLSIRIPAWAMKAYIGVLVLLIGIVILVTMHKTYAFSWKKIVGLGLIASFNKGMSGGGYGPVITGGQVLVGVDEKGAIGTTSAAEGLTCIVGVILYATTTGIDSRLALPLVLGAMCSVPISVHSVRVIAAKHLRLGIGLLTIVLGAVTLIKLVW